MNIEELNEVIKKDDYQIDIEIKSEPIEKLRSERAIVHYISTSDVDRVRDVLNPKGMDDKEFSKTSKPVWYAHNYKFDPNALPIGRNLWLKKKEDGVLAKTEFNDLDFSDDVYRLHLNGFINTWSVGVRPVTDSNGRIKDGSLKFDEKKNITYWDEWKLVEYSSAPLPANVFASDVYKSIVKEVKSRELKSFLQEGYMKVEIEEQLKSFRNEMEQLKNFVEEYLSRLNIIETLESNERYIRELDNKIKNLTKKLEQGEVLDNPALFKKISEQIVGDTVRKYVR